MEIFSAQKNRSTTAPSLTSPVSRNFHLEVSVKQMFVIFQTAKPTEIFRILHFGDGMDLSKYVYIHRKKHTLRRYPLECPGRCIYLSQSFEA